MINEKMDIMINTINDWTLIDKTKCQYIRTHPGNYEFEFIQVLYNWDYHAYRISEYIVYLPEFTDHDKYVDCGELDRAFSKFGYENMEDFEIKNSGKDKPKLLATMIFDTFLRWWEEGEEFNTFNEAVEFVQKFIKGEINEENCDWF